MCKHADLVVQRNEGYRWVTCASCTQDFVPEPPGAPSDVHKLSPELEIRRYDAAEEAFIVLMPGRLSGQATVGHRRISTQQVADTYWHHGFEELESGYDFTLAEVVIAVWYESRYGTRTRRKRWSDWLEANAAKLWSPNFYGAPDIPPTKESAL